MAEHSESWRRAVSKLAPAVPKWAVAEAVRIVTSARARDVSPIILTALVAEALAAASSTTPRGEVSGG